MTISRSMYDSPSGGGNAGGGMPDWLKSAFGMGTGAAGIGSGLMGLFGGHNDPSKGAMSFLDQIPGLSKYFQPYADMGMKASGRLGGEYENLMGDPGGMLNKIGAGYHESPGFKFALQQAMGAGNRSAAAGGMAGSPMHEQENMGTATNLANKDYMDWLGPAMNLYGKGLAGEEGIAERGYGANTSMADMIAKMLASKSQLSYEGAAGQERAKGGDWSNLFGGAGMLAAFLQGNRA